MSRGEGRGGEGRGGEGREERGEEGRKERGGEGRRGEGRGEKCISYLYSLPYPSLSLAPCILSRKRETERA